MSAKECEKRGRATEPQAVGSNVEESLAADPHGPKPAVGRGGVVPGVWGRGTQRWSSHWYFEDNV